MSANTWPHSWVAYFAGCVCDECRRFDHKVFDRPREPKIAQTEPKEVNANA